MYQGKFVVRGEKFESTRTVRDVGSWRFLFFSNHFAVSMIPQLRPRSISRRLRYPINLCSLPCDAEGFLRLSTSISYLHSMKAMYRGTVRVKSSLLRSSSASWKGLHITGYQRLDASRKLFTCDYTS